MIFPWLSAATALAVSVLAGRSTAAQEAAPEESAIVERVDIANNQFIPKETLLFYVSTKPGERYDERRLKEDFRRLWDTGFLNDLTLEVLARHVRDEGQAESQAEGQGEEGTPGDRP